MQTISPISSGISWEVPTGNTDASPVTDLSHYVIRYFRISQPTQINEILVPSPTAAPPAYSRFEYEWNPFPFVNNAEYELWIVAVDSVGNESNESDHVQFYVDGVSPRAVSDIVID